MSVEDRLLVLLTQVRQSGGDAVLRDPHALRSRLSSQAPDLHGEIQALAAALAMGAPARVAAAADPAAERAAVAAEIAGRERLSMGVVQPAVEVACLAGTGGAAAPPPRAGGDWVGDSIVAGPQPAPGAPPVYPQNPPGYPPHMPVSPDPSWRHAQAAQPWYKNKTIVGVAAAGIVIAAFGFSRSQQTDMNTQTPQGLPAPNNPVNGPQPQQPGLPQPGLPQPGQPQAQGGQMRTGGPMIAPRGGNLPLLQQQASPGGSVGIGFNVPGAAGPVEAIVVLPAGGWDAGNATLVAVESVGNRQQSVGSGRFQRIQAGSVPVRLMQIQWEQDGLGAGPTCIAFEGTAGQSDVALSGSTMCVMDGACSQAMGCGRIQ